MSTNRLCIICIIAILNLSGSPKIIAHFYSPSGLSIEITETQSWCSVYDDGTLSILLDTSHKNIDLDVKLMENLDSEAEVGVALDGRLVRGVSCLSVPCSIRLSAISLGNHSLQARYASDGQPCRTFKLNDNGKRLPEGKSDFLKFELKSSISSFKFDILESPLQSATTIDDSRNIANPEVRATAS